jgi:predicted Rossmann fold flavoprotein
MIYDCITAGAGASGLFFSASANRRTNSLILEKTARPGTKLLMSGSGQCNITHAGSIKDFLSCYGSSTGGTGSRIRKCLYRYSNISLVKFLEDSGIRTVTRDDGKIFPASMDAHDILQMLLQRSEENGFVIKYGTPAERIVKAPHGWSIFSGDSRFDSKVLVIACGGCSYPSTGSDGSIFHVLERDLGIHSTELRPALSSVQVKDYPYRELSGISFENASVTIQKSSVCPDMSSTAGKSGRSRAPRQSVSNCGGLLFTHKDFSGPAVLNISKHAAPGGKIQINYLHPLSERDVLDRLKKASSGAKGKLSNIIAAEFNLPKRFCQILTDRYGESLKKLARQMTCESFEISSVSGFRRAMCTCGGVELPQIDLSSMEVKGAPGLFVIGEALDIDGITGGYNLQFAYSSARAAADCIMP